MSNDTINDTLGNPPNLPNDLYPIHIPNSIQSHGILVALDSGDLSIVQISANAERFLGITPQQLLGTSFEDLLGESQVRTVTQCLSQEYGDVLPLKLSINTPHGLTHFDSFIHRIPAVIIVEMEPINASGSDMGLLPHTLVRKIMTQMQQIVEPTALLNMVVQHVQELTGYDRVLIYKFDRDGAGQVIAEAKKVDLPPYLGLHFPARDIPEPIREFYTDGKMRFVPDMQAEAVSLLSLVDPKSEQSLNLSHAMLRSVDPCCVEYYSNMGMSATLVVSMLQDQTLWGLLACHHSTPKQLPYDVRAVCDLLVQVTALEITNKSSQEDLEVQAKRHSLQAELISSIAEADNFIDALIVPEERLLSLVEASGAVICLGKNLTLIGNTPEIDEVRSLIDWADQTIEGNVFHTHQLSHLYPEADAFKATASGMLLLRISLIQHYLILWFRPEVIQSIDWGGHPDDGIQLNEHNESKIGPRTSFERWQETVYASSIPWQPIDVTGALELRNAIVGIVLNKIDELAQLNRALRQSNQELASFAHSAAHDLKEPLRGIYNYANIVVEDYAEVLDPEGQEYLQDIQAFAQRMETLINALLRISQLRQTTLQKRSVNLNKAIQNAVDVVQASWPETEFEVQIPRVLPPIQGDAILVNEVFRNLISNAIKYNEYPCKRIEVGYLDKGEPSTALSSSSGEQSWVFYVRDNGIGIRKKHLPIIFKLFKRLHPQELYGGGAGVGLAVVNQIIERHGGHIWVESTPGEGSTFFFTFGTEHMTSTGASAF